MRSWWKGIGGVALAAMLAIPVWADTNPAQPGALNYVEGQVAIGSQPVTTRAIGSADLNAGQVLDTQNGKAEILLTPGVFLRLDNNSAVRMDSPGLANTELTLLKGRALIEVNDIRKENDIVIHENGIATRLMKKGLYEFDANTGQVRVFDGKAEVMAPQKDIGVGGGHLLALNDPKLKTHGFSKNAAEKDEFYRWAKLRSSYLAEANVDAARQYYAGGPGWYGPGWYWDPGFASYTWIPGDGMFWSPFGWGFYSPWDVYSAPLFIGGGFGGYHRFGPGYHPPVTAGGGFNRGFAGGRGFAGRGFAGRGGFAGGMRGGSMGGFHGGFGGGGFHGGGGGFHGGGGRR
jgi:hypothetical protein